MGELLLGTNCANTTFEKLCARLAKEAAYVSTVCNAAGVDNVVAVLVVSTENRKANAKYAQVEALRFAIMGNTDIGATSARTNQKHDSACVNALYIYIYNKTSLFVLFSAKSTHTSSRTRLS
jgi:hypothetical protein